MPRKKPSDELSLGDMGSMLSQGLSRAATTPTVYMYVPHSKQVSFHSAREQVRLYIGGNRSGKTVGGVVEDVYRLRGEHPFQPVPPAPTRGRVVGVSYQEGVKEILLPEFGKWLPPSDLINGSWEDSYAKGDRKLTLSNGSTCEFMSYDQQLEKFAGTSRHFVHFDEEPPEDIYEECRLRLVDTAGHAYITMTPVNGMTWVYEKIYKKGLIPGSGILVIQIDSSENPYISEAQLMQVIGDLDDDMKKARKKGEFVAFGGLAFSSFNKNTNVIPELSSSQIARFQDSRNWTLYASMDHGLNNPTAWLWHAARKPGPGQLDGVIITFDEIYGSNVLVDEWARQVHEHNRKPGRVAPAIYVGDPAIAQRQAVTGESIQTVYMKHGVPIVLGKNDVKVGVNKMNMFLKNFKWLITENCSHLISELETVRWKRWETAKQRNNNNVREEIQKKNDHAPDSARYLFSLLPDLHIPDDAPTPQMEAQQLVHSMLAASTSYSQENRVDRNLTRSLGQDSRGWDRVAIDETVGGEW
jgi:phage terminase large subunit-like protein